MDRGGVVRAIWDRGMRGRVGSTWSQSQAPRRSRMDMGIMGSDEVHEAIEMLATSNL